jgi:hypothetical protein
LTRRLPYRLSDVFAAASNTRNFELTSLSNASETYANSLAAASTKLTDEPVVRKQYVDEVGIKDWRERRLMIAFVTASSVKNTTLAFHCFIICSVAL